MSVDAIVNKPKIKKKARIDTNICVACGACAKVCPRDAINIVGGVYAKVYENKCIGCSLCTKACPASIIDIIKVEVNDNE